jgi:protein SCO1
MMRKLNSPISSWNERRHAMNPTKWSTATAILAVAMLTPIIAWAGDEHVHAGHVHDQHAPAAAATTFSSAAVKLTDIVLTDQDERQLRLLSDVVADKVVVVSFVYTTCTTVCPVVSHLLSQVQQKLGGLLDSQVRLVSLTVDPLRDTPRRLKAYSGQHGAGPGWLWLTGTAANVTEALKGFGTYSANFENHPAVIMVGDGRSGQWSRIYGFEDPETLVRKTHEYLVARDGDTVISGRKE